MKIYPLVQRLGLCCGRAIPVDRGPLQPRLDHRMTFHDAQKPAEPREPVQKGLAIIRSPHFQHRSDNVEHQNVRVRHRGHEQIPPSTLPAKEGVKVLEKKK